MVVITEFHNNEAGRGLRAYFTDQGLLHHHFAKTEPKLNSTLIASREPFLGKGFVARSVEQPYRMPYIRTRSLTLAGAYMPNLRLKIPYWERLVAWARRRRQGSGLIMGDFNTGRYYLDEAGATYTAADYMDHIEKAGFQDLWRARHPEAREFTWYSHRQNGFRLDHGFGTAALRDQVRQVSYDHTPREEGLSDHSLMVIELSDPSSG